MMDDRDDRIILPEILEDAPFFRVKANDLLPGVGEHLNIEFGYGEDGTVWQGKNPSEFLERYWGVFKSRLPAFQKMYPVTRQWQVRDDGKWIDCDKPSSKPWRRS